MNGKNNKNGLAPMEMESMRPMTVQTSAAPSSSLSNTLKQLGMLIRLYMEAYPAITGAIFLLAVGLGFFVMMELFLRNPLTRNEMVDANYAELDSHYNFKAASIHHWCLWVSRVSRVELPLPLPTTI